MPGGLQLTYSKIWALQMSLQRKFAVLAVLLVGSLLVYDSPYTRCAFYTDMTVRAIACGITRMVYYILSLAPGCKLHYRSWARSGIKLTNLSNHVWKNRGILQHRYHGFVLLILHPC